MIKIQTEIWKTNKPNNITDYHIVLVLKICWLRFTFLPKKLAFANNEFTQTTVSVFASNYVKKTFLGKLLDCLLEDVWPITKQCFIGIVEKQDTAEEIFTYISQNDR